MGALTSCGKTFVGGGSVSPGGPGSDTTAIHVDVPLEIDGIAVKALPVGADVLVIEDSADAFNKKKIEIGSLSGQPGDVVGPAGAQDDFVCCFDGITGKLIKEGTVTCTALAAHLTDTANPHATSIANIGSGTLAELNAAISDADVDATGTPRPPTAHASTHSDGGSDEITVENLATASATTTEVLSPDGAGGLTMRAENAGMLVSDNTVLVGSILSMANAVGNLPQASALREIGGSLCYALLNATGVAVPVGAVMEVNAALASSVVLAGGDTSTFAGLCAEVSGALATDLVWMAISGEATVNCTAGAIVLGDHIDSAGAGEGHTHGFATGNTFGVAVTTKGAAAGPVQVIIVAKAGNGDVRSQLPSISIPNMIPTYPGVDAHVIGISGMFIFLTALCVDLENKTGGTISLGEILKADDSNDNAVVLATAGAQIDAWAGIAMAASVADGDPVYCGFSGVATVLCDATAVVRGDYIEVGPTAGLGAGFATSGPGSFGVALTGKGAGIGTVQVLMRGMETF